MLDQLLKGLFNRTLMRNRVLNGFTSIGTVALFYSFYYYFKKCKAGEKSKLIFGYKLKFKGMSIRIDFIYFLDQYTKATKFRHIHQLGPIQILNVCKYPFI